MSRKDYWRTKTEIPHVATPLLSKRNILEILDNSMSNQAVCLIAPYGYGKTMSVISWLRESGLNAVWITLDAADNTKRMLFAGLSAAMLRFTGWNGDMNDVLSDPGYIENPQEYFWETVSEAEKIRHGKILVLDNFQYISDHELQRSVKDIISELLKRWRVVLMSRSELPPFFAELMLKGQICMITPAELSFSPQEMTEFFALNSCTASEEEVLYIKSVTGGWPASLNVVYMISRGGALVYNEAARRYVMGFFETEIWDGLDERTQDFLLKTSVPEQLTPVVCRAITGISATLPILQQLFANGLFISKLNEEDTYCYHQVFRDYLLYKLTKSDIDERELYRKLGWWLYDKQKIEKSFPCFFKAGDLYGVSQVLRTINPTNIGGIERFLEVIGCITELDMTLLKPYQIIVARIALVHFLTGNIESMQSHYKLLLEWDDSGDLSMSQDEYAEFLWEMGWLYFLDPDEPTMNNQRHEEWLSFRSSRPYLGELQLARSSVLYFPSMLKGVRDYGNEGLLYLEAVIDRIEHGEDGYLSDREAKWLTYLLLAEFNYERERFAEAESIIRHVMSQVEENQLTFIYFICTATLVKIVRAIHNPVEIDALTNRLETMILENGHTFLLPNFHAFQMRCQLAEGHLGFTEVFEEENKEYESKPYFFLIYRHLTLVRGLLSLGSYSRAMVILGNLELLCNKYKRPTDLIEVNILQSVALYHLGYEEDACLHLKEALMAAKRYGFIRMFSDEAKNLWPVLEQVRRQTSDTYIQSVIISCKKTLARSGIKLSAKKYPHTDLTKSELKILRALQNGMSYREIAQDNGVSLSTVRSHLHSAYSKLGASNKTEAVIAAQNLGIIE